MAKTFDLVTLGHMMINAEEAVLATFLIVGSLWGAVIVGLLLGVV